MQVDKQTYKDLDDLFHFDFNPVEKYKTPDDAHKALLAGKWGKSNLLIPKDKLDGWFKLAAESLKHGVRTVIINTFNPHYKYWFKYVWPYAAKVVIYTKHCIIFNGYDNPCPKTVAVILFDPEQQKTARKDLIHSYVDDKYPYFRLPLKIKSPTSDSDKK